MKGDALPLIYICTLGLLFLLSGCTIKPTSSTEVKAHFIAATDINKNRKGVPSPPQIFIYRVTNGDNFHAGTPLRLLSSAVAKRYLLVTYG